tara:strand:+ start:2475 stop:2930 length:456 start_codon:yes stop_codon:yes gene_type:complete
MKMNDDEFVDFCIGTESVFRNYYAENDGEYTREEGWMDCCNYDIDECMKTEPMSENMEGFSMSLRVQKSLLQKVRRDKRRMDKIKKGCEKFDINFETFSSDLPYIELQIDMIKNALEEKIDKINMYIKNMKSAIKTFTNAKKKIAKCLAPN